MSINAIVSTKLCLDVGNDEYNNTCNLDGSFKNGFGFIKEGI